MILISFVLGWYRMQRGSETRVEVINNEKYINFNDFAHDYHNLTSLIISKYYSVQFL